MRRFNNMGREKPRQLPVFFFQAASAQERADWRPSVDIYRTRNGWLLKYDLAGVAPEDIDVQVCGCRITVSGVRRDCVAEDVDAYYSMEIAYNRFERTVELPCQFANPHVAIESRNGILTIRVTED
jgi:HSP20 family protein